MTDIESFLAQNDLIASGMTEAMIEEAVPYATHHAGNSYVLLRQIEPGRLVKMHDSWTDESEAVVHFYDPNALEVDETEEVHYFHDVVAAFETFLGDREAVGYGSDDES